MPPAGEKTWRLGSVGPCKLDFHRHPYTQSPSLELEELSTCLGGLAGSHHGEGAGSRFPFPCWPHLTANYHSRGNCWGSNWRQSLSLPEQSTHFRKSSSPGRASCAECLDVEMDFDCCTRELSGGRLGCESARCFMGIFHLSTSSGRSRALPRCFSLVLSP